MVDRHLNSGKYNVQVIGTNTEAEDYLRTSGIRFTRSGPLELQLVADYDTVCKLKQLARHVKYARI